jgi:hypothetical protein
MNVLKFEIGYHKKLTSIAIFLKNNTFEFCVANWIVMIDLSKLGVERLVSKWMLQ